MDWNELTIFVKVVQEGSFISASRSLGVPRSTVSRKIAALEDRLGVRLLQRTTRSVNPTDEGRAYFERCAPLVREAEAAARAVSERQDVPQGLLRVTAPTVLGHHFMGPIVSQFMKTWPDVQVEVFLADRIVNLVEEGFDVAIRAGRMSDSNLIARRLAMSDVLLVASPSYLHEHGRPEGVEDLESHRAIYTGQGQGPHHWTLERDGEPVQVQLRAPLVVNDLDLVHHAAVEGLGIGRVPRFMVVKDLACGRLVEVLPGFEVPAGGVYAVYPSRRHLSATVRAFVELLDRRLGAELTQPDMDMFCVVPSFELPESEARRTDKVLTPA